MGSEIYPKVHENPRAFFSSSSPILLELLAHGSSDWSLPREDFINNLVVEKLRIPPTHFDELWIDCLRLVEEVSRSTKEKCLVELETNLLEFLDVEKMFNMY